MSEGLKLAILERVTGPGPRRVGEWCTHGASSGECGGLDREVAIGGLEPPSAPLRTRAPAVRGYGTGVQVRGSGRRDVLGAGQRRPLTEGNAAPR